MTTNYSIRSDCQAVSTCGCPEALLTETGVPGYNERFKAARASAICGSLAVEFSKWLRNSW